MSIPKAPITYGGSVNYSSLTERFCKEQRDADHTYYTEGDGYKAIKAEITAEFVKWLKEHRVGEGHYYNDCPIDPKTRSCKIAIGTADRVIKFLEGKVDG